MSRNCGALRTRGEQIMATPEMAPVPSLPRRFRAAAAHYLTGRPPYPPRLVERVAALTGLPRDGRVLDLGCGPGMLAQAFAPLAAEVMAVDPEPEMLRVARRAAGDIGIRFLRGSSYDLGPALGRFDLVVMGRSFHWMDRAETLRRLDPLVEAGGAVVLFGDAHPDLPDNAWRMPWREAIARFRDPDDERPQRGPGWVAHEAVLLDSAFARLDTVAAIDRRCIPVGALVERALSRSSTMRSRSEGLGRALSEAVLRALEPFVVDGMITEVVEAYALIATRPGAA